MKRRQLFVFVNEMNGLVRLPSIAAQLPAAVFQYLINQKQLHQHNAQSTQKIDLISLIC